MFRSFLRRAAAAAAAAAPPTPLVAAATIPSMREVADSHFISRMLGGAETFGSIKDFTAILDKAKGAPVPQAKIGRAVAFMRRGDLGHALADLNAALSDAADGSIRVLALALRTAVRNQQLDLAESQAGISGAVEEGTLSSLREQVKRDLTELREANPLCWTIELAEAEFLIYNGNTEAAKAILERVASRIEQEIAQRRVLHTSPNTEPETEAAVAFAFNRTIYCEHLDTSGIANATIADAAKHHLNMTPALKAQVAELRGKYGVAEFSDEEVARMASVSAAAGASHHYYQMFPMHETYATWGSRPALELRSKIHAFYAPRPIAGLPAQLSAISKPESPVPGKTVAEVKKAIDTAASAVDGGADILDLLEAELGHMPTSALTSGDRAFHDALDAVDASAAQHPSIMFNGDAHRRYLDQFICELLEQAAFRVDLDSALCLERENALEAAKEKLDKLIAKDKFLYMWKALLARGRINKALGRIDEGEADFKLLHTLKRSPGADIPLLDENRYKSTF